MGSLLYNLTPHAGRWHLLGQNTKARPRQTRTILNLPTCLAFCSRSATEALKLLAGAETGKDHNGRPLPEANQLTSFLC